MINERGTPFFPIGYTFSRSVPDPVGLPLSILNQHLLVGGASGSGKSTSVLNLALGFQRYGGVAFFDTKGDESAELIRRIPYDERHRLSVIRVKDTPETLNLLDTSGSIYRDEYRLCADLSQIVDDTSEERATKQTPRQVRYLRQVLYAVLRGAPLIGNGMPSLIDVKQFLASKLFRSRMLDALRRILHMDDRLPEIVEQIDVAVRSGGSPGVGAEQDDAVGTDFVADAPHHLGDLLARLLVVGGGGSVAHRLTASLGVSLAGTESPAKARSAGDYGWSGRLDLNQRPSAPKADVATSQQFRIVHEIQCQCGFSAGSVPVRCSRFQPASHAVWTPDGHQTFDSPRSNHQLSPPLLRSRSDRFRTVQDSSFRSTAIGVFGRSAFYPFPSVSGGFTSGMEPGWHPVLNEETPDSEKDSRNRIFGVVPHRTR